MGLTEGLLIVLVIAAILACALLGYALVEAIRTLRSARELCDDLARTVPPLVEKADVTIEALGVQLLRVDGIVTNLETTIDRVSHTTEVVQEAVNAPAVAVNAASERIREAWSRRKRARG